MVPLLRPLPGPSPVNWANPLVRYQGGLKSLTLFNSLGAPDLVTGTYASRNSAGSGITSVVGQLGRGISMTAASGEGLNTVSAGYKLFPDGTDRTTICVIRRKKDTTARASSLFVTCESGAGNSTYQVSALAPYSDGSVYWQFGLAYTNRFVIAGQTWDTDPDYFIFVGGPTKGAEVWRRGTKIGSNTGLVSSITGSTMTDPFSVGCGPSFASSYSMTSDSEEIYYIAVFNAEWPDSLCRAWFENPYQVLRPQDPALRFLSYAALVSGTVYNKNFSVTESSSFGLVRAPSKIISLSGGSAAVRVYNPNLLRSVTESNVVGLSKPIGFARSGSTSEGSAASLAKGAAYNQSSAVTGGSTAARQFVVNLVRAVTAGSATTLSVVFSRLKTMAVTDSTSAALIRGVSMIKAISSPSAATLIKTLALVRAVTEGSSAAFIKGSAYFRTAAATAASVASLTRASARSLTLAVTNTATTTLARLASRLMAMSYTSGTTASLARVAALVRAVTEGSTASKVFAIPRTFAVSETSSVAFSKVRVAIKTLAATGASAATFSKLRVVVEGLVYSATSAATLARQAALSQALAVTATLAPALRRSINRVLVATTGSASQLFRALPETLRTQANTSVLGSAATGHGARILQGSLVGFGHSLSKFARLLGNTRIYVEVFSPNALLGGTHVVIKFAKTTLATAYHSLINNIQAKF